MGTIKKMMLTASAFAALQTAEAQLKVLGNGNVGIGTATPITGLDVRQDGGKIVANGLYFYASPLATDGLPMARLTENWGMRYASPDNRWALSTSNSLLSGYLPTGQDWGSGNIFASGNIGIGTTTPLSKLHIKLPTDGNPNRTAITLENPYIYGWNSIGIDFKVRSTLPPAKIVSVDDAGQPNGLSLEFHIVNNGVTRNSFAIDPVGNAYLKGVIYQNQSFMWSDKKLKNNIKTSDKALEKILQLRGVLYDAIDSVETTETIPGNETTKATRVKKNIAYGKTMPHKSQYGFVAQELELVLPNLVTTTENDTKAVNYVQVIPLLVEAIKEQNTQIDVLKAEVKKLKGNKSVQREESGTGSVEKTKATSVSYLYQNTPNPFSEETTIKFSLPETVQNAFISITDLNGKQLKSLPITTKGESSVTLKANELYAGIFVYTLVADGNIIDSKRMVIVE
ncbi:MAG: T9SS C-terminal target domain-containing protein [Cytophagales bacterium]|nr:MAG: T9SS C-terminal target domain-containing protein [Cytophagales bacterium]